MRTTIAILAGATALSLAVSPAVAQEQSRPSARDILGRVLEAVLGDEEQPEQDAAAEAVVDAVPAPTLETVLAHERRNADRARDQYRNPAATLAFFQIEPTQTVVEWGPGGGWYTRVLAPYLAQEGAYVAVNGDSDGRTYPNRNAELRAKGWTQRFRKTVAEMTGVTADQVAAYELDEVPEGLNGTADRVLIFRSMHGLWNADEADEVLGGLRKLLADEGMVGVVQHRAPANASWSDVNPARGYMRQTDIIKLFELHGFRLVSTSEVNANPRDPANWERGVWTLPPVLTTGEDDPRRDEYLAIGESDRMTLLFRKVD
ncbi:class I SAM-dependent methyltransferase [Parerythrobacter aestuarii]|uniref:class I SAM-dependent methyltransferase n=1 Tax=Parerythrobacter aestuarii TaxID=3020909 RepID=UPI0024DE3442|nr:hypothetical protein [Parerythrobacter aestuarii]